MNIRQTLGTHDLTIAECHLAKVCAVTSPASVVRQAHHAVTRDLHHDLERIDDCTTRRRDIGDARDDSSDDGKVRGRERAERQRLAERQGKDHVAAKVHEVAAIGIAASIQGRLDVGST